MTWLLIIVTITGITTIHTSEAQCKAALPSFTTDRTRSVCIAPNGALYTAQRGSAVLQP